MNSKGNVILISTACCDAFIEYEGYKQYTIRIRNDAGDLLDKRLLFDYTLTEAKAVAKYLAEQAH